MLDKILARLSEKTSLAAIMLGVEQILTSDGDKTIAIFLSSIQHMTMNELSNTFFPLIIALGLLIFKENDAKDKMEEGYAKLKKRYIALKKTA